MLALVHSVEYEAINIIAKIHMLKVLHWSLTCQTVCDSIKKGKHNLWRLKQTRILLACFRKVLG